MRASRIAAVTAGLMATGAVVGAVLGMLTMLALSVMDRIPPGLLYLGLAAGFGAAIGAVLAPTFAWVLLRSVPLGRAIGGTALGTMAGVLASIVIQPLDPIVGALVGFSAAATALRLRAPRSPVETDALDGHAG